MLTAFSDSERVFAALKAGAVGYLLKNASPDEIRATVERAAAGEPMLSGEIAGRVLREFEREREEDRYREQLAGLTAREEEILKLLATGESNREIGRRLFISEQTVKNHVASIFRKLQVNDRTKAALLAVQARARRRSPRREPPSPRPLRGAGDRGRGRGRRSPACSRSAATTGRSTSRSSSSRSCSSVPAVEVVPGLTHADRRAGRYASAFSTSAGCPSSSSGTSRRRS